MIARLSGVVFCVGIIAGAYGQTGSFSDDFSAGASNWVPVVTDSTPQYSAPNGHLEMTYDGIYFGLLRHHRVFKNFTYSASVTHVEDAEYVGIVFLLKQSIGGFYFVLDQEQRFALFTYPDGGGAQDYIAFQPNSAIRDGENTLTVSKENASVRLMVNGQLVYSFEAAAQDSGKIGLVLSRQSSGQFDNVTVTPEAAEGTVPTCVAHDFSTGDMTGWYTSAAGTQWEVADGVLSMQYTGETQSGLVYSNGDYAGSSISVAVRQSGGGSGSYGLFFGLTDTASQGAGYRTRFLEFLIDSSQGWGIVKPEGDPYQPPNPYESAIHGHKMWDTLEVIHNEGTYTFKANGFPIIENFDPGGTYAFTSVGVSVRKGPIVEFDNFTAKKGSSPVCPVVLRHRSLNQTYSILPANSGMYNVLGRAIGRTPTGITSRQLIAPGVYLTGHSSDRAGQSFQRVLVK